MNAIAFQLEQQIRAELSPFGPVASISVSIPSLDLCFGLFDNEPFPAASVIKIAVLGAGLRMAATGELSLDEVQLIPRPCELTADATQNSGVLRFLTSSCRLTLRELLILMMVISDNIAADLIIKRIGMSRINSYIRDTGASVTCLNAEFRDSRILMRPDLNPTCARELVKLIQQVDQEDLVGDSVVRDALRQQVYNERLPRFLRSTGLDVWNKTGTLARHRRWIVHDVAVLRSQRHAAYVAVLMKDQVSFTDAQAAIANVGRLVAEAVA